jgi:starch synthase (maltosyl-transferring)
MTDFGKIPSDVKNPLRRGASLDKDVASALLFPAIYYCDVKPTQRDFDDAASLGFTAVGIPYLPADVAKTLPTTGRGDAMGVVMDVEILATAQGLASIGGNSDRSNAHEGDFNRLDDAQLSMFVARWDEQIDALQKAGIQAFRCLNIGSVQASVWRSLIGTAKQRQSKSIFYAWTVGLAPDMILSLRKCGFDFVFSSSCWWDFKSGWLNEEASRLLIVAPAISLAAPPNIAWSSDVFSRKTALDLAAFYGPGWLMPAGFQICGGFDLSQHVSALNEFRHEHRDALLNANSRVVSSAGADIAVLARADKFFLVHNTSVRTKLDFHISKYAGYISGTLYEIESDEEVLSEHELQPKETKIFGARPRQDVTIEGYVPPRVDAPRIAIESITPQVDTGEFPVRRVVGENVVVEADLIADGHDKIAAELIWRCFDEETWQRAPMTLMSNDRWRGTFPLKRLGRHVYAIISWKDIYATFVDEITKKNNAGIPTTLEVAEGMLLLQEASIKGVKSERTALDAILMALRDADDEHRLDILISPTVIDLMRAADIRKFAARSHDVSVDAERIAARFASWYEIFPRSQSGDGARHGTFRDVIEQLPRIAAMRFDVLYFPPIHPIGRINRKGRNNSLSPSENDPGSPYAIGSDSGGHDAIHPELGGIEDFRALVREASRLGLEIALDFAIQCAPDHPWLVEHKDWFDWRPDGSIKYAENPPKKYQDIVNVDFYAEGAKPSLWLALRDVVQFWINQGVRIFRVDNPHTKPFPFWEWLIDDIRRRHPDTIFLAEAFTRPKVMYRLAKIGFSQSYTYFTWRNTKAEFTSYITELNETAPRDFFRPHFFVNTPDINPIFLHDSGRPGFLIRAALAATLSGLWGVYNGFELCEATPLAPGKEEYLDSEKYQLRAWDYDRPGNIIEEITKLNSIRRGNAALQNHLGVQFHTAFDDDVLFFSKTADDGNVVLAAICLDPFNTHQFKVEIPLHLFNLLDTAALTTTDLMRDFDFTWRGKIQDVTLHPQAPFCIWRIRPEGN